MPKARLRNGHTGRSLRTLKLIGKDVGVGGGGWDGICKVLKILIKFYN